MTILPETKILIIEDEKQIARIIELQLKHNNYDVKVEYDGIKGLNNVPVYDPDLILLDIMLPGLNGLEVCKRIREYSTAPIIMLTAKDQTIDKVSGLDIGANDYITKPFETNELLARIRAALRTTRRNSNDAQLLVLGDLSLDLTRHFVKRSDKQISLTKKEYDLLEYLLKNNGLVLSREQILNNVWNFDYEGEANVVDVYIRYLRSKIDDDFEPKLIHTVRGFGYVLEDKNSDV
jgi:Response regulators consisting of a CheY-like receiver domain and a winged-helix DNA-binding domain